MSPSLVFHDGQGFLVGNGLGASYWTEMGLRVSHLDGRLLASPAGDDLSFIMPVAGFDQQGHLNLLWAEPSANLEAAPRMGDKLDLERVFHAVLFGEDNEIRLDDKPVIWSQAELLYSYERTIWRGAREARSITAPDGTLHVAFPSLGRGIVHLRRRHSPDPAESSQRITELHGDRGLYVDIALGPDGDIYLPYIAGDPTGGQGGIDANSVFFRRSTDGGDSWEKPVLVSQSGRAEAHFIRVAVTASGEVHLVWLKNLTGGNIVEVVWHSISEDGGRTWSEPHEIAAPGGKPYGLGVAADSSGAMHVVFVSTNAEPHDALYYIRWNGDEWSTPCLVDPNVQVAHPVPAIATDDDGRVHLVWNRGDDESNAVAVRSVLQSNPEEM